MLMRLRKAHPVLYCLLAEAVFLIVLQLGGLLLAGVLLLLASLGVEAVFYIDDYALDFIGELSGVITALVFLCRTGRQRLITRRGSGFLNGLLVGMWLFVLIALNLASQLFNAPRDAAAHAPAQIFWFFASMLAVGVAEEFLARGVIAQTLLEHYGTSRAGVWKACLVSGAIFGAGHLINLLSSAPFGVLMQCVFAASLGVLLAAIYFRTGNLWVVVFLHALMDTAALWDSGIYGTTTVTATISGYDTTQLYALIVYGLPVLYLLRKKKIGEVALYFGADHKN